MTDQPLAVPDKVSFEQAIALTQSLLSQIEQDSSDAAIEKTVAALVSTENGARGFFVTYLSDDRPIADQPSAEIVRALQSSPAIVSELLVKNLAMSSAMALTHRRQQNEPMAQGSERVRSRTAHLIQLTQLPEVAHKAEQLRQSAQTGTGVYQGFLDRWGYDAEQRQVIGETLQAVLAS